MKKLLSVLLLAVLVLAGCSTGSKVDQADKTLTVLNGAPLTGFFISGYDNSSYDADVVNLLNKASTVYIDTKTAELKFNKTIVDGDPVIEETDAGKTYTYKIKSGLKYSDGTDITAKDFVFTLLLRAHSVHMADAGYESVGYGLVGYKAYSAGETDVFEGVKLIDDHSFSVTIDKDELPYFYERSYVNIEPSPIHVWFPNAAFNADGSGFTNTAAEIQAAEEKVQSLLENPTVSTGPYVLESYQNAIATFTLNEHYAGDENGNKAAIGKVIIRNVADDLLLDSIKKGEGDFAAGFIQGDDIKEGLGLSLKNVNFPRSAYGKIMFKADTFPTNIKEVRQALGYVVDRNKFVEAITGGYGSLVDGPYGLSLPQYIQNKEEINSKVNQYTLNIEKANSILDATDFKFEADGKTPFDPAKAVASYENGYFRYNSEGKVLEVKHYATVEAAAVSDLIGTTFPTGAAQAGIKYTFVSGDWATMMSLIKGQEYNAYNFATSYPSTIYDPLTAFHSDFVGASNTTGLADAALDAKIDALRNVDPADADTFGKNFIDYVVAWNDLLPELPLYSNQVYSFSTDRVEGLDVLTPYYSWAQAIEYISLTK